MKKTILFIESPSQALAIQTAMTLRDEIISDPEARGIPKLSLDSYDFMEEDATPVLQKGPSKELVMFLNMLANITVRLEMLSNESHRRTDLFVCINYLSRCWFQLLMCDEDRHDSLIDLMQTMLPVADHVLIIGQHLSKDENMLKSRGTLFNDLYIRTTKRASSSIVRNSDAAQEFCAPELTIGHCGQPFTKAPFMVANTVHVKDDPYGGYSPTEDAMKPYAEVVRAIVRNRKIA